ncbi:MAG: hypothetical protein AVDCRST_MAG95-2450 [uncultured Adhaeribacter sp.]|uniref:Uncharacterized protein n=1 Tax=uncultured Adhaeribacter sp. TaxID=448109 RepID=A0A6J4IZV8_9BACT|nr:MAG: hypothetical protein AVDCRST_MAG95-2450 [uncultured Adhaeribacter sp.]
MAVSFFLGFKRAVAFAGLAFGHRPKRRFPVLVFGAVIAVGIIRPRRAVIAGPFVFAVLAGPTAAAKITVAFFRETAFAGKRTRFSKFRTTAKSAETVAAAVLAIAPVFPVAVIFAVAAVFAGGSPFAVTAKTVGAPVKTVGTVKYFAVAAGRPVRFAFEPGMVIGTGTSRTTRKLIFGIKFTGAGFIILCCHNIGGCSIATVVI